MNKLFRLSNAQKHDYAIDEWLSGEPPELHSIARHWFAQMRCCGDDVVELVHDGYPVVCIEDAAFAYVSVFSAHVNIGFFTGAFLNDPEQLLEGTGKRMRHVKLKPGRELNTQALNDLIENAYKDVKERLRNEIKGVRVT